MKIIKSTRRRQHYFYKKSEVADFSKIPIYFQRYEDGYIKIAGKFYHFDQARVLDYHTSKNLDEIGWYVLEIGRMYIYLLIDNCNNFNEPFQMFIVRGVK